MRILVVRMGAMGDVIHALPAVMSLKRGIADAHISWLIHPRWAPLVDVAEELIPFDRKQSGSIREAWTRMRERKFDLAVDFQGLIKSGLAARASGAKQVVGYHREHLKEKIASWFYSTQVKVNAAHIVDQHVELAASCGGRGKLEFSLPAGVREGDLPEGSFVLACPIAGWGSKEWPLERYGELGKMLRERLGMALVLNGHSAVADQLRAVPNVVPHVSSIAGLIDATRRAAFVVGIDSGPLHLAAALSKRGVAIFGPTDPTRNGPYGNTLRVLRTADAVTSYKRLPEPDASMKSISADMVLRELEAFL